MRMLLFGGTVFLSAAVAAEALRRGHELTCVARGESGGFPAGVTVVRGERTDPTVLAQVAGERWDAVVDVGRRPSHVRSAVQALTDVGTYVFVSTCSVYRDTATVGADESGALLDSLGPTDDETDPELYGRAKVSCEALVTAVFPESSLLCRAGLIVGPGDPTDRFGAWPAVLARGGDVLAPGPAAALMQVLDVRDLAAWLVDCSEQGRTGTYDAVGPAQPLGELLETLRSTLAPSTQLVWVDPAWLLAQGVSPWSGPESLPLWLGDDPDWAGFCARSGAAARAAGLAVRPLADTARATLDDERERGLDRSRRAGLTPSRHAELLAAWADRSG